MNEYSIGLDIGNASVGWAVINDNYELHKYKKKNMWGVRLFEQAQTAQQRRIHRTTTRRLNRRRERIKILQELLGPMIMKVDPAFFIRLQESFLWQEDRTNKNRCNLFVDVGFTDSQYYAKYKTIYHLRKELMESDEKADPRLIYLALHHLIKYRGHFIYEGQTFKLDNSNMNDTLRIIMETCVEMELLDVIPSEGILEQLTEVLKNQRISRTKRVDTCLAILNLSSKSNLKQLFNLIVGIKSDLYVLFKSNQFLDDKGKGIKVSIVEDSFEEYIVLIDEFLGENANLIKDVQRLYSLLMLNEVLGDCKTISEAMVQRYNVYKEDLDDLKVVLKKYNLQEAYQKIFKEKTPDSYFGYTKERSKVIGGKDNQIRFYQLVTKELGNHPEVLQDAVVQKILGKIENKQFLIFLNMKVNSAIPYQLQLQELEAIILKQSRFYDELNENKEKIKSILTFKIPYYVGPLNEHSPFAWVKKKSQDKIKPWNFYDVIDESASAEAFIAKMTNYCTYLRSEPVLPAQSIIYSRFKLLNELNKVRINSHLISLECKQHMWEHLFLKSKRVTKKSFLEEYKIFSSSSVEIEVTGLQEEEKFASTLKSEQDFNGILGEVSEGNIDMVEQIIYWITVFEEPKMVRQKIEENYLSRLTSSQIEEILKLKYKEWGKLSKKLLTGIKHITPMQEKQSIMDCLKESNDNFMQLINDENYQFKSEIEKLSPLVKKSKLTYDDVEQIYGSPAIKRGVWQSIQIIQEIEKIMGCPPKNIFLEFARSDEQSKRTKSRYKQLEKIYQDNSRFIDDFKPLMDELKMAEKTKELMKKKYYLYFIQLGKCMYSKKSIDINRLSEYQIDHIIPQSIIKDDSLDNLVLVEGSYNQEKLDYKMPLDVVSDPQDMKFWWNHLYSINLITKKKYINLTTKEFSEEQLKRFINRQLVETRQITKEVASLLEMVYEKKVVTIKAQLVHDLRAQFDLEKCREINDYHHAHDAFLVSVLGSYLLKKYPNLEREFVYAEYLNLAPKKKDYKSNEKNKYGFIVSSMKNDAVCKTTGEVVWHHQEAITTLKKTLNYKDCFITKRLEENQEFYKITLQPKIYENQHKVQKQILVNKEVNLVPMKKGMDVKKYGGYLGVQESYYSVIEYNTGKKKNPLKKELVGIPTYIATLNKNNSLAIEEYLEGKGYREVKILLPKVMKNQLVETNGQLVYLTSSSEWNNAKQLTLTTQLYQLISKYLRMLEQKTFYSVDERVALEELNLIFTTLSQKMKQQYGVFESVANKLIKVEDKFQQLTLEDRLLTIKNILVITQANASNGNLKKVGLTDREGRLGSKNLNIDQTIFINQSVTGMFEKRIRV